MRGSKSGSVRNCIAIAHAQSIGATVCCASLIWGLCAAICGDMAGTPTSRLPAPPLARVFNELAGNKNAVATMLWFGFRGIAS